MSKPIIKELNEEEFEKIHHSVDIPKVNCDGTPSEEWYCVDYFESKEAAIKYAQEHFGADENGMVCLVSKF